MRVLFNLMSLGAEPGGAGRYVEELVSRMPALGVEPVLFGARARPRFFDDPSWCPGVVRKVRDVSNDGAPYLHLAAQAVLLDGAAKRHGCDLIHGPVYFGPTFGSVPSVITVLDLMWWEHPGLTGFEGVGRHGWNLLTRLAVRHARRVLTISQAAKSDIERLMGTAPSKIDVTLLGGNTSSTAAPKDEAELRRELGLEGKRILLCVAQKRPHKNHETVIRALSRLPEDVVLVAPGADDGYGAQLRAVADGLGVADRVRMLEWVDDETLEGLFAAADVVVQMSLMEGFGLPALEAMQRGIPVVVSDTPALAEVVGEHGRVVAARDSEALASSVAGVLGDPVLAGRMRLAGHERARLLTWDATAQATVAAYEAALRRSSSIVTSRTG
jgi:glycosyltransferase involved in cell wall biosynthesis